MPVPCASSFIFSSAIDAFVNGTKIKPSPTPRRISGQNVSSGPLASVMRASIHIEAKNSTAPTATVARASRRFAFRPTNAIVIAEAMAPGRMTRPV